MNTNVPTPAPSGPSPEIHSLSERLVCEFEGLFREWMMPGEHADAVALFDTILAEHFSAARLASAKRIADLETEVTHWRSQHDVAHNVMEENDEIFGNKLEAAQQQSARLAAALGTAIDLNHVAERNQGEDWSEKLRQCVSVWREYEALRTYNELKDV